jgi:predicted nucleic acid-binding protein
MTAVVLDTGALIAVDRRDPRLFPVLKALRLDGVAMLVPAGCLAQAVRRPRRQAALFQLLGLAQVNVLALDRGGAQRVGMLLAYAGTSDVVDGHVALAAIDHDATVFTSDPDDIRRLAPGLRIQPV